MARMSEKYNEACLKIFALLLLFAKGEADFSEVIKLFADSQGNITQNSNVILNKYMNTVKIFGVEVEKVKGKYILKHMPFSLKLEEEDLQAVALIKSAVNFLPEGKNKSNLLTLLKNLQNLYDKDTRLLDEVIYTNKNFDLSFYFKQFNKQIAECEDYLQSPCKLEIVYHADDKDNIIFCIPKELKYFDKVVCYSVYNTLNRQILDLPIDSIRSIRKISDNALFAPESASVIFKLKGALANRYRLREWETTEGKDKDGCLTVVNSGEDYTTLTSRLLRYDDKCVVLSPECFKNQMITTLDKMLANY